MSEAVYRDLLAYGAPELPEGYKYTVGRAKSYSNAPNPDRPYLYFTICKEVEKRNWYGKKITDYKVIVDDTHYIYKEGHDLYKRLGPVEKQMAEYFAELHKSAFTDNHYAGVSHTFGYHP